jgi:hypothetical protein
LQHVRSDDGFILPLKIMNVGDCEIYVDITHGLNLL